MPAALAILLMSVTRSVPEFVAITGGPASYVSNGGFRIAGANNHEGGCGFAQ